MDDLSEDEVKAMAQRLNTEGPKVGEVWEHYKGGEYDIVARPLDESTLTPLVVYRSRKYGTVWSRPLYVFVEWTYATVNHQGFSVHYSGPRFKLKSANLGSAIEAGGELIGNPLAGSGYRPPSEDEFKESTKGEADEEKAKPFPFAHERSPYTG